MPMYDYKCPSCGVVEEHLVKMGERTYPCESCGGDMEHVWVQGHANSVTGDEIDVWVKHALCHEDGSPRHFTSREELKRAERASPYHNHVEHITTPGTDKSKHTTRWI